MKLFQSFGNSQKPFVSQREHGSQSHALERINSASCIVCGIGLYSTARAGTTLSVVMGGWLIAVLVFFGYPLSAFTPPLTRLKESGLVVLGAQATRFLRAAERKTIGRNIFADPTAEPDGEIADPPKLYDAYAKLSTMLISRAAVIPVAAAALVPFAIAGATKLPYKEVFSVLKKLLLL